MNRRLLFLFGILACWISGSLSPSYAQSIRFDNVPPLTGGGLGSVGFNLTTNEPIVVDSLRAAVYTATGDITVWYNPDKINGAPTIDAANGWINLGKISNFTGISTNSSSPVVQTIPLELGLQMAPGDTFGFFLEWGKIGSLGALGGVLSTNSSAVPIFSDSVVSIIADPSSAFGYSGGFSSMLSPRQINGGVVYHLSMEGDCAKFADFKVDSIVDTGFRVDWTPGQGAEAFYLEYGISGFIPGSSAGNYVGGTYPANRPPLHISGLTAETDYDIYFWEICNSGNDSVYFPQPVSVTTAVPCPPIEPPVHVVYRSRDSLSLDFHSYGTFFDIEYGTKGFTAGTGTRVSRTKPIAIGGLTPLTTYDIYIRNNCNAQGKDTSDWYGPVTVTTRCAVSMSGTYTIDPNQPASNTNFLSFTAMADELNTCGLSGPVVVSVAQGVYNEQVYLGNIEGSSPVNTILIQADPGNTASVEISYSATGIPNNYVWRFDSTSYVTINGLTLTAGGTNYAKVVDFTGVSTHISLENNVINGATNANGYSAYRHIIANNNTEGDRLDYFTLKNNRIYGGGNAILMEGPDAENPERGNIIEGNTVEGFGYAGLFSQHQEGIEIKNNHFISMVGAFDIYGAILSYTDNTLFEGNRIVTTGTGGSNYSLQLNHLNNSPQAYSLIANNMISCINASSFSFSAQSGLHVQNCDSLDVINNSIFANGGSATQALYINRTTDGLFGFRFLNNNVAYLGNGIALKIIVPDVVRQMDYNNYYFTGTGLANFDGSFLKDLVVWRRTTSLDSNSLNIDPLFAADDSLYTSATLLNNRGIPYPGVDLDIDGVTRSTTFPDIGAHELPNITGDCSHFTDFSTDSITDSGMKVSWTPGSGNTGFYLEYGAAGFTPGNGTHIVGTYPGAQPPLYIDNLTPDTEYDVYFGEYCNSGADSSYIEANWRIKTLLSCLPVEGPVFTEYISSDSAAFSFQTLADSTAVLEYEYGPVGYEQGTGTQGVLSNPGGFGGLSPLSNYDLYLRSNCSSSGGSTSPWFGPYTFVTQCAGPLTGIYTIDGARSTEGKNFQSFAEFVFNLEMCGVSGPVTVNVAQGLYAEKIHLGKVAGVSETNTIVFQADPANTAPVEIEYTATGSGDDYVWRFDSTSYVTVRGMTLTLRESNGGRVIDFSGRSTNITIEDNILNCITDNITAFMNTTVISNGTTTINFLENATIRNNEINGGHNAIVFRSMSGAPERGNRIDSNIIKGYRASGMEASYQDGLSVQGNTFISKENATYQSLSGSTVYGINLYSLNGVQCVGNKVIVSASDEAQGIYMYNLNRDTVAETSSLVANNMVTVSDNTGSTSGLYVYNCSNTEIVHNSILITDGSIGGSQGLHVTAISGTIGLEILNNIIVNSGGGIAVEVMGQAATSNAVARMDYNNYFVSGPDLGSWSSLRIPDLASWTLMSNKDSNSVSGEPLYTAVTDLHAASPLLKGAGTAYPLVLNDYDGEARSSTTPDIGADEFILVDCWPSINMSAIAVYSDSIFLNWIPGAGDTYNLEYGPEGYTRGTGTRLTAILDTAYMLRGLSPQLTYDIYVSDYCGATDTSIWFGPFTVRTICKGRLSGTYTINKNQPASATNYTSFTKVATDLNDCGIGGPVIFNVAGGTYRESIELKEINGASALNTITFQPDPADTQAVILQDSATKAADNYVIRFNGTSYASIRGITMEALGSSYSRVIEFSGISRNIVIEENILRRASGAITSLGATLTNYAVIMNDEKPENRLENSTIRNNRIIGGSYGLYWYGISSADFEVGNTIKENTIEGFISAGIHASYQDSIIISGNKVTSANHYSVSAGVQLNYCRHSRIYSNEVTLNGASSGQGMRIYNSSHTTILDNKIVVNGNITSYGLHIGFCNGEEGNPVIIANNMISVLNNSGTTYGIYFGNSSYVDLVYNSVLVNAGYAPAGHAFYAAGTSTENSVNILNNNIVNTGPGLAVEIASSARASIRRMNYNNIYSTGLAFGNWGGASTADIAQWKTVTLKDTNSVSGDPQFVANDDLHYRGILLDGAGTPYPLITTDIDGEARSLSTPDIGADEYTPLDHDMGITRILSPANNSCGDSSTMVSVVINNYGLNPATGFTVGVKVQAGGMVTNQSVVYTRSLAYKEADTVQLSSFNTAMGGIANIEAHISYTDDMNSENDTIRKAVNTFFTLPLNPVAAIGAFCVGGGFDTLYFPRHVSPEYSYYWLTKEGDTLGDTDAFVVGPLGSTDTSFVLSEMRDTYRLGPDSNNFSAGENYTEMAAGLSFKVKSAITIDSVFVYPNDSGMVVVNILKEEDVVASVSHTISSSVAGRKTAIPLDVKVTQGTYRMTAEGTTTGGLFRNEPGATFPYAIQDVMEIANSHDTNDYYYFFYDWHVTRGSCGRPDGEVVIEVGIAESATANFVATLDQPTSTGLTVDFDASSSVNAISYDWDFGDGSPAGSGVITSHIYPANGSYPVTLTVMGDCGLLSTDTLTKIILVEGIDIAYNLLNSSLEIYPNPVDHRLQVRFEVQSRESVVLRLTDLFGKLILEYMIPEVEGKFEGEIDMGHLAKGTYLIEIESTEMKTVRKVIKQ